MTGIYFCTVLEAGSLSSVCQHGWALVRALFLVYRPPPSHCVLLWQKRARPAVSSYKDTYPINEDPTLMTSFNLNYLHRSLVSKQRDSEGRGLQHMNFEGDTIQHITRPKWQSTKGGLNSTTCQETAANNHVSELGSRYTSRRVF